MSKEKYRVLCEALKVYMLDLQDFEEGDLFLYSKTGKGLDAHYTLWVTFDDDDNYVVALENEIEAEFVQDAKEVEAAVEDAFEGLCEFLDYTPFQHCPATLDDNGYHWTGRITMACEDVEEVVDIVEEMFGYSFL